jgi:hypothetical protein
VIVLCVGVLFHTILSFPRLLTLLAAVATATAIVSG